jgi:dihydroxyacetone kinase
MNQLRSIEDVIKTKNLTTGEISRFDDFIKDAQKRKTVKDAYVADINEAAKDLKKSLYRIADLMEGLADRMGQIAENMEKTLLGEMPDSSFCRE